MSLNVSSPSMPSTSPIILIHSSSTPFNIFPTTIITLDRVRFQSQVWFMLLDDGLCLCCTLATVTHLNFLFSYLIFLENYVRKRFLLL